MQEGVEGLFLIDGLEAEHSYQLLVLLVDLNGRGYLYDETPFSVTMPSVADHTPPQVVESELLERTATTATLRVAFNEVVKRLRVRYRIVGTDEWTEKIIEFSVDNYEFTIDGLTEGEEYEYQYYAEDLTGNILFTDWAILS